MENPYFFTEDAIVPIAGIRLFMLLGSVNFPIVPIGHVNGD